MKKYYAFLKKYNTSGKLHCYEFFAESETDAIKKANDQAKFFGKNWYVYGGPCIDKTV